MDNTYKVFRQIQEKGKQYSQFDNFDREDLIEELIEEKRINENDLKKIDDLQQRIDKAVEVYDRSIDYLTTINTEFWDMDGNTRQTILDIINRFEKELNILKGDDTNESKRDV